MDRTTRRVNTSQTSPRIDSHSTKPKAATKEQFAMSSLTQCRYGIILMTVVIMLIPNFARLVNHCSEEPVLLVCPILSSIFILGVYIELIRPMQYEFANDVFIFQLMGALLIGIGYAMYYRSEEVRSDEFAWLRSIFGVLGKGFVALNIVVAVLYDGKKDSYWRKFKVMVVKEFTDI